MESTRKNKTQRSTRWQDDIEAIVGDNWIEKAEAGNF